MRWLPALMLLLISMSWSGCKSYVVISADQQETMLPAGKAFTPAVAGVFMTQTRYQRYRRAVADAVLAAQVSTNRIAQ